MATISFDVNEYQAAALMGLYEMMLASEVNDSKICDARALWWIAIAMQWDVSKLPRFGGGDAFMAVSEILWLREAADLFYDTARKVREYASFLIGDDEELLRIADRVQAIDQEWLSQK